MNKWCRLGSLPKPSYSILKNDTTSKVNDTNYNDHDASDNCYNYNVPVCFPLTEYNKKIWEDNIITRYSVYDKKIALLTTESGMQFIKNGSNIWNLDISNDSGITNCENILDKSYITIVNATWVKAHEAMEQCIDVKFNKKKFSGDVGVILVPDNFTISSVVANEMNTAFYDVKLVKNNDVFTMESKYDMVLGRYNYALDYRLDYEIQLDGGGGYFIEIHDFPHIHIPLSKEECGGYIVIGKELSLNKFAFTAFEIPYGYGLYTPANIIHGDGTLVGPYGITISRSEIPADVVVFYNENSKEMQHDIVPPWPP